MKVSSHLVVLPLVAHFAFASESNSAPLCDKSVTAPIQAAIDYLAASKDEPIDYPSYFESELLLVSVQFQNLACAINEKNLLAPPQHRFQFLTIKELEDMAQEFGRTQPFLIIHELEFRGNTIASISMGILTLRWEGEEAIGYGCGGPAEFEKVGTEWQFRGWGRRICS